MDSLLLPLWLVVIVLLLVLVGLAQDDRHSF
jgi:hypothetical protein